ncbi:hypothetical protein, conserved [Eimeria brunetti]|uniref:Uncharacterized protein n=1 Tax=Eimeria brunetti TaxID=51314 RepID=U6LLL6_9EIME|nr:hypothetical protein, conserved [Eimeria brunetti]
MGDCTKWTAHAAATVRRIGQRRRSVGCTLLSLLGFFVVLVFHSGTTAEPHLPDACQVDENYRPIVACISVPFAEVEGFYANRNASFPQAVERVLKYIVSAIAINIQTLPYFLTRLRNADGAGSAAIYALTQVSTQTKTSPKINEGRGALQVEAAPSRTEIKGTRRRFFLSTPGVVNVIHSHCGYNDVPGLELALKKSGPSFFEPGSEGVGALYPRTEGPSMDLLLAAMDDTGWYLTDFVWSPYSLGIKLGANKNYGCRLPAAATSSSTYSSKHLDDTDNSFGVSEKEKAIGEVNDTRPAVLQGVFLTNSEYEQIMCVSDNDKIEAPMMLPTSKPVKWVAAQVISRLPNGTEKTTVCMRGEKGQEKPAPGSTRGVIQCPDVDILCYGRPCKNGGVPRYGVCFAELGTLALVGQQLSRVCLCDAEFRKLPAGVAIDSRTGAIFGTPVEVTKGCVPLAIEVQMREIPHAAERTLIRINVVEHLLIQSTRPTPTPIDDLPPSQGHSIASLTPSLNEDTGHSYINGAENEVFMEFDMGNPRDCERYVDGDMRGNSESRNAI